MSADELCPLCCVRESCARVVAAAKSVSVDSEAVAAVAQHWRESKLLSTRPAFDRTLHFVDESRPALTVQFLFVVDALNWCFWPSGEAQPFEYHNLAGGLKASVEKEPKCLDARRLAALDGPSLRALLGWEAGPLPLEEERARVLRQTAGLLQARFGGSALAMVESVGGSASRLVDVITSTFPAFRDTAVYDGRQVFLYKRAQIFVGDLFGAFDGKGPGAFADLGKLTMFADYRVPVVLRQLGILRYAPELAAAVDGKAELQPGSEWEVEIRAASVVAVERLREALGWRSLTSIVLDWALWEMGEAERFTAPLHHRTKTVFY